MIIIKSTFNYLNLLSNYRLTAACILKKINYDETSKTKSPSIYDQILYKCIECYHDKISLI